MHFFLKPNSVKWPNESDFEVKSTKKIGLAFDFEKKLNLKKAIFWKKNKNLVVVDCLEKSLFAEKMHKTGQKMMIYFL
jgi:hypothetical protein